MSAVLPLVVSCSEASALASSSACAIVVWPLAAAHQGGEADGVLQVDARAALQQHPHHRLLPSCGGRHQQRRTVLLCAVCVHAAALVQPRSHSLRVALARRISHGYRQPRLRLVLGLVWNQD